MSNKNIKTTSATKVPALSSLPGNIDPALKTFLNGIVQALEIRLGRRGDSRDRAVTIRELIDSGLAKELAINPYDPNAIGITTVTGADTNVLTTAVTTPSGLTAVGGFTLILLNWDLHSHLDHSHTEIWRHTSDDRNNSIRIGNSFTRFFSDQSVVADTTYYYWIRHVNEQGVISEWNAESGVSATTQPDIEFLLTLLTGEIRSTQLYSTLATDVGRIPGWHLIIGAYDLSSGARTLSNINTTMDGWHDIIGSYNNNRTLTQIDTGITDIIAVNDTQGTAITGIKNSVYVNGDSAQGLALATASALTSLTTSVTTNTGGIATNVSDIAINTTATTEVAAVLWLNGDSDNPLLLATASALSTTNSNVSNLNGSITANASDIDDLEAAVDHPTTGLSAQSTAIDALEVTVNSTTDGVVAHSTKITALESTVNDTTDGVSASANAIDGLETIVNHSTTGVSASAGRLTTLETKVNTTDGGMATADAHDELYATVNTGTGSHAAKITNLETKVNTTDGGMATANAHDSLYATVNTGTNSHASKITTLETKVNTTAGGMATADAHDSLYATVNTGTSSHAAKLTTLETKVNTTAGGMATADAHDALYATVNTGTSSHASKITTLETKVNTTAGGMATADAHDALYATVNTGASSHATKITTLEATVNTTEGGLATADALAALQAQTDNQDGDLSAVATDVTALQVAVDGTSFVTKIVTVAAGKFVIEGVSLNDPLILRQSSTYTFDQSNSTNATHPLRFSITSDGTHNSGVEFTAGVTTNGTPGTSGAYTRIVVPTGAITGVTVSNGGSGYTSAPTVTFTAPSSGTTATGTAIVIGGVVTAITITNAGVGYTSRPTISFSGGAGSDAKATVTATAGIPTLYYYCSAHSGLGGTADTVDHTHLTRAAAWDVLETKIGYSYLPNHAADKLFDNAGNIKTSADVDAYNATGDGSNPYLSNHDNYVAWQAGMPMAKASTQIEVSSGSAYHTLQELATTQQGADGLLSQYTVKIETLGSGASARKVVGGFGLSAEPAAASGSYNINFGVLADKFFIEAPAANQPGGGAEVTTETITPFSVITSPQTFGSTTLPSGVYMDAAYLKFGSITEAHIGIGVIDTAHCGTMNASIINAGEINATFIKLDNATIEEDNGAIIIKDLGVTNAKIDNLAVDTLKIGDNAVTVPYGLTASGNISIAHTTSNTITSWTLIGEVVLNYGLIPPTSASIILSQMLIKNTSGTYPQVMSMAFRIFDGSSWLATGTDAGRVGEGKGGTFTLTTGYTYTPNQSLSTDCITKVQLYARQDHNLSHSWTAGIGHIAILGTKK